MAGSDDEKIANAIDAREPYEAPTLECEELFEVIALSCGKINPSSISCLQFPRLS